MPRSRKRSSRGRPPSRYSPSPPDTGERARSRSREDRQEDESEVQTSGTFPQPLTVPQSAAVHQPLQQMPNVPQASQPVMPQQPTQQQDHSWLQQASFMTPWFAMMGHQGAREIMGQNSQPPAHNVGTSMPPFLSTDPTAVQMPVGPAPPVASQLPVGPAASQGPFGLPLQVTSRFPPPVTSQFPPPATSQFPVVAQPAQLVTGTPSFGPPPPPAQPVSHPPHQASQGQALIRDDFDIHVQSRVRNKIEQGKYIEMCELLRDDPRKRGSSFANSYESSSDEEAVSKEKRVKKARCLSEEEWREAFSIFGFILTQVQPEVAPGLFVHQNAVMSLMSQRGDWNFYDITIRKLICRGKRQWGEESLKEFLEAKATKSHYQKVPNKFDHKSGKNDFDKVLMVPKGFCVNYHKNGKCVETKETRCPDAWFHICFKCMGADPHRASLCKVTSKQSFRGRGRGRPNRK